MSPHTLKTIGLFFAAVLVCSAVAAQPAITSPTPGSTLTNSSVTFQWSSGAGVLQYYLAVGSSTGATDIYSQNQNLNLSATVTNLPADGSTLYVRLSWLSSGNWHSGDSTYTAPGTNTPVPVMISPAPGSILTNSSATFQWTYGAGAMQYYLSIGSAVDATNIYSRNQNLNSSVTVTNLPTNGMTLFVQLSWLVDASWVSTNYTYSMLGTNTLVPAMTSPAPGSTLTNSSATFQWTYGEGVTKYYLAIGSTLGATNIYNQNQNLNSSATVAGLPTNGLPLYVQLSWLIAAGWESTNYTYTMVGTNTPVPAMTSPAPGAALTNSSATFQWTYGVGVLKYAFSIGSTLGSTNIYYQNQNLNSSVTITNLPTNGMTLYARLSWLTDTGWQTGDYTYTAFGVATPYPAITSPDTGSPLTNSSATFQWTSGTDVSKYYLSIGSAAGLTDIYNQNQNFNLAATVTNLPANGMTLYVRLSWLTGAGWQFGDYTYTAAGSNTPVPQMISPFPGSTLPSSSATFHWTYGSGVSQYYLGVGKSAGASDIYYQNQNLNVSATVTGLPTNGAPVYVQLWWLDSAWQSTNYIYQAVVRLGALHQGTNFILSWPTNDPAYTLEYATDLPATDWFTNPVTPAILNGRYTVTNATPNPFTIYRLTK
jgi:serine protease